LTGIPRELPPIEAKQLGKLTQAQVNRGLSASVSLVPDEGGSEQNEGSLAGSSNSGIPAKRALTGRDVSRPRKKKV